MIGKKLLSWASLGIACAALCADGRPDPAELDKTPADERYELLVRWAKAAEDAAGPRESGVIRGPEPAQPRPAQKDSPLLAQEWKPVLARLAKIPAENPKLVRPAIGIFNALGKNTPECELFCKAIMSSPDEYLRDFHGDIADLLRGSKAGDAAAPSLIEGLSKQDNPDAETLRRLKDDPVLKAALLTWAAQDHLGRKICAFRMLPDCDLTEAEAGLCIGHLVRTLTKQPRGAVGDMVTGFYAAVHRQPQRFRHCLDVGQKAELATLLKTGDSLTASLATYLLLLGARSLTRDDIWALLDVMNTKAKQREADLLVALGFLPAVPLSNADREHLLACARKHAPVARTGLLSLCWRSGGDYQAILKAPFDQRTLDVVPDAEYWAGCAGQRIMRPLPPADWRSEWGTGAKPQVVLSRVLQSVEALHDDVEVAWVLKQAIAKPEMQSAVIETLWHLRNHPKRVAATPEVKIWLVKLAAIDRPVAAGDLDVASQTSQQDAVMAALFVQHFFGDGTVFPGTQQRLGPNVSRCFTYWSRPAEMLLRCDPASPLLDALRAKLMEQSMIQPGNDWLVWLLDLRRGQPVQALPVMALASALKTGEVGAWLESMPDSGPKLWNQVDSIRDTCVFIAGSGGSPRPVLRFLGVLDRLEIARREAGRK